MTTITPVNVWASADDNTWDLWRNWFIKINTNLDNLNTDKAETSDIADFETTTELNARDTANRARANHTWTQTASTISDFDTEVSNNTSVTANTAKRTYPIADETKLAWIEDWAEVNPTTTDELTEWSTNLYDKTVAILNGAWISVSWTYPNFTVTNSSPDQVVSLTEWTWVTITWTYPNFTIASTWWSASAFTDLTDTPANYTWEAWKFAKVNGTEDWLEFSEVSWTGDLVWPASSTDSTIPLFDWTTWKLLKDSVKTIVTTLWWDDTTLPTSKAVANAIWSSWGWDMLKAVYDPTTVEWDAFDMDNMVEWTTNKILTASERTAISTNTEFNIALSDIDFATLDWTETLTNKSIVVTDHWTATTDEVVNVCYWTSATPPTASTTTEWTLYIQYTA